MARPKQAARKKKGGQPDGGVQQVVAPQGGRPSKEKKRKRSNNDGVSRTDGGEAEVGVKRSKKAVLNGDSKQTEQSLVEQIFDNRGLKNGLSCKMKMAHVALAPICADAINSYHFIGGLPIKRASIKRSLAKGGRAAIVWMYNGTAFGGCILEGEPVAKGDDDRVLHCPMLHTLGVEVGEVPAAVLPVCLHLVFTYALALDSTRLLLNQVIPADRKDLVELWTGLGAVCKARKQGGYSIAFEGEKMAWLHVNFPDCYAGMEPPQQLGSNGMSPTLAPGLTVDDSEEPPDH